MPCSWFLDKQAAVLPWMDLHVTLRLSSNASTKVPLLHWSLSEIDKTLYSLMHVFVQVRILR